MNFYHVVLETVCWILLKVANLDATLCTMDDLRPTYIENARI